MPANSVGDLTGGFFSPNFGPDFRFVDDVTIFYRVANIDGSGGVLGRAGPTRLRSLPGQPFDGTTISGIMEFDAADVAANFNIFPAVILHEMAHVLGITSTAFNLRGCFPSGGCVVGSNANTVYTCTQARAQFALVGCSSSTQLRLETSTGSPGSDCSHWSEGVFETELMTPVSYSVMYSYGTEGCRYMATNHHCVSLYQWQNIPNHVLCHNSFDTLYSLPATSRCRYHESL